MDDMFLYHASNLFEWCLSCANSHVHIHIMMDDVYIYHAHTFFGLCLFCVGTHDYLSTSQSHELTKRALESNDDLGSHGLYFPPLSSRKDFTHFFYMGLTWLWVIVHYVSFAHITMFTLHDMLILCLCHAFVTHALHYTWWLILILVCVFASLVEISLVIAMFALCPMPMMILWSCFVFVLAICHVHCLCLLFAHMTCLPWFPLVCCIFALLACTTWLLWLIALLHHRWFILAHFMWLMTTIYMLCTWLLLLLIIYLHMLPLSC